MRSRPTRLILALAGVVALFVAVWIAQRPGAGPRARSEAEPGALADEPTAAARGEVLPGPATVPADALGTADLLANPFAAGDRDADTPWASVDLEAVRAAMPDNIYWKMSSPTRDPEVLREREEERARWNVEYGKVLSNTATEEEILAYYGQRERLSSDYVQFATHLLKNYGKNLGQQDIGLLKVALELHLALLEEIPRQIAQATERSRAHAAAREAWLADQAAFAGKPANDR